MVRIHQHRIQVSPRPPQPRSIWRRAPQWPCRARTRVPANPKRRAPALADLLVWWVVVLAHTGEQQQRQRRESERPQSPSQALHPRSESHWSGLLVPRRPSEVQGDAAPAPRPPCVPCARSVGVPRALGVCPGPDAGPNTLTVSFDSACCGTVEHRRGPSKGPLGTWNGRWEAT